MFRKSEHFTSPIPKRPSEQQEGETMYFLILGIILLLLKYLEIGPVAAWSWVTVLAPFGLAALWWAWADWSGYTKRKAMEKEGLKKERRLQKSRDALGQTARRRR
jgi:small Trp-rich protein